MAGPNPCYEHNFKDWFKTVFAVAMTSVGAPEFKLNLATDNSEAGGTATQKLKESQKLLFKWECLTPFYRSVPFVDSFGPKEIHPSGSATTSDINQANLHKTYWGMELDVNTSEQ
jgi:hypothetical protein